MSTYRPYQEEAIKRVAELWDSGHETVILDAPVGAGKTFIAADLGRRVWDINGWKGYFSTPLVPLVVQVQNDPLVSPHILTVAGRGNYECGWVNDDRVWRESDPDRPPFFPYPRPIYADEAPCVLGARCSICNGTGTDRMGAPCEKKEDHGELRDRCPVKRVGACEYYRRRDAAIAAPLAGMTLAYLLRVTKGHLKPPENPRQSFMDEEREEKKEPAWFGFRDYLFLDEAHNLERAGIGELSFNFSERTVDSSGWRDFWNAEVLPAFGNLENLDPQGVQDLLSTAVPYIAEATEDAWKVWEESSKQTDYRRWRAIAQLLGKSSTALDMPGDEWLFIGRVPRQKPAYVEVGPVTSRMFLTKHLWPLSTRRVLSSGMFGDIAEYLEEVGLPSDVPVVRMPSSFPPRNGPIIFRPIARLSRQNMDVEMPNVLFALETILDAEPERGLIHANSYALSKRIQDYLERTPHGPRLYFHDSDDRNDALDRWLKSRVEGGVFVAVAMTDGLDLAEDLARWQVILKAPYADLSDIRVQRRRAMKDGDRWYRAVTSRQLWQATGRIVRSATDVGRTYVLDANACDLMAQTAPSWGRDRISAGSASTARTRPRPWETTR
jgi:Rad3-related DNA helicase